MPDEPTEQAEDWPARVNRLLAGTTTQRVRALADEVREEIGRVAGDVAGRLEAFERVRDALIAAAQEMRAEAGALRARIDELTSRVGALDGLRGDLSRSAGRVADAAARVGEGVQRAEQRDAEALDGLRARVDQASGTLEGLLSLATEELRASIDALGREVAASARALAGSREEATAADEAIAGRFDDLAASVETSRSAVRRGVEEGFASVARRLELLEARAGDPDAMRDALGEMRAVVADLQGDVSRRLETLESAAGDTIRGVRDSVAALPGVEAIADAVGAALAPPLAEADARARALSRALDRARNETSGARTEHAASLEAFGARFDALTTGLAGGLADVGRTLDATAGAIVREVRALLEERDRDLAGALTALGEELTREGRRRFAERLRSLARFGGGRADANDDPIVVDLTDPVPAPPPASSRLEARTPPRRPVRRGRPPGGDGMGPRRG